MFSKQVIAEKSPQDSKETIINLPDDISIMLQEETFLDLNSQINFCKTNKKMYGLFQPRINDIGKFLTPLKKLNYPQLYYLEQRLLLIALTSKSNEEKNEMKILCGMVTNQKNRKYAAYIKPI